MLWIALELPALPLQIAERGGSRPSPFAIAEGPAQRPVVLCANAAARDAGVREGMAVAAAKALASALESKPRDPVAERAALERLAGWACQFTPMVAIEAGGLVLEIEESLRLFGGLAKLTGAIRQGVRALGFHATYGVAPTPLAARLFARAEAQGVSMRACLDAVELPARVGELPLFLTDWPARSIALLTDLGVLRFRDVLALPRAGLAKRFGPEVGVSLDRVLALLPDPREPYIPHARFHSKLELPAEAKSVEAILFPLKRLLVEMEGFLRGRGAGVQRLVVELEHSSRACTRLPLEFGSPEREADFVLSIAREKLSRTSLAAPAIGLKLHAEALLEFKPREESWLPGREEQAVDRARLLERLAARLGEGRVFGIALANDHRPERSWLARRPTAPRTSFDGGPRPVWLLHRPQRLIAEEGQPKLQGALDLVAGPERIESGWWDGEPVGRDYFVAVNPAGEALWVYREHRNPAAWYLHGVFA